MNSKQTAVLAAVVTAVAATFLAGFTATPDPLTQVLVGTVALIVTSLVLVAVLWLPWTRGLPDSRRKSVIWLVAAGTAAVVTCVPLVQVALRR